MYIRNLIRQTVLRKVIKRRAPDFVVGNSAAPSMERWRILKGRIFSVYIHRILKSDQDDALHDHPWASFSWLISGSYIEVNEKGRHIFQAGSFIGRRAEHRHRILVQDDSNEEIITIFCVGRKTRDWGFWHGDVFESHRKKKK